MSIDVKVYREKVDMISKDLSHGPLRVLYCQDVSKLTNEVERLLIALQEAKGEQQAIFNQAVEATRACIIRRLNFMGGRNAAQYVESLDVGELPTLLKV